MGLEAHVVLNNLRLGFAELELGFPEVTNSMRPILLELSSWQTKLRFVNTVIVLERERFTSVNVFDLIWLVLV